MNAIQKRLKNRSSDFIVTAGQKLYDDLQNESEYIQTLKKLKDDEIDALEYIRTNNL